VPSECRALQKENKHTARVPWIYAMSHLFLSSSSEGMSLRHDTVRDLQQCTVKRAMHLQLCPSKQDYAATDAATNAATYAATTLQQYGYTAFKCNSAGRPRRTRDAVNCTNTARRTPYQSTSTLIVQTNTHGRTHHCPYLLLAQQALRSTTASHLNTAQSQDSTFPPSMVLAD
jgi:hypothetical protein